MTFALWFIIIGILLITIVISSSLLKRLPLSTSMLYLAVGFGMGPGWLGLLDADPIEHSELLERLSEIAVIISLFVAGLKLSLPLRHTDWYLPLRLATLSMITTIALITVAGILGLGLSLGAAVLLGSILAPTDPVLASDVQVEDTDDRDRMRFSLSGEAGFNDGTAFPFVILGLGLLGLHELGTGGWKWFVVDIFWGIGGGLAIGGMIGFLVGKLVVYLRVHHGEAVGLEEFLVLGLIALSYGVALLAHALGFLAVFAAGLALRRVEEYSDNKAIVYERQQKLSSKVKAKQDSHIMVEDLVATNPECAVNYITHTTLHFNEQLERLVEIAIVLITGAMLSYTLMYDSLLWFVPLLFFVIRPISVWLGLLGSRSTKEQRWLTSWFGIRGIGSIYYLMYAINNGIDLALAEQLVTITLIVVSTSIVVHGISVTPLMRHYSRRK